MIRYLIIDDETAAHQIIGGYCDLLPSMQLAKNCYDALDAVTYLGEHSVDLIFLDLNLPRLKGFDFLRSLPAPPRVIVTTAYAEHALEGYALNVVDYLLKPFGFPRFLQAVNKAIGTQAGREIPAPGGAMPAIASIFLRENKKYVRVEIGSVLFLEAAGNYTKVVTERGTVTTREKISNLLAGFPTGSFLRVHKSFAVAVARIDSIEANRIAIGKEVVPVGKQYRSEVRGLVG